MSTQLIKTNSSTYGTDRRFASISKVLSLALYSIRGIQNKAYLLQIGNQSIWVYCHMKGLGRCDGNGWTLVMKMNGSKVYTAFILKGKKLMQAMLQKIKTYPAYKMHRE